MSLSIEAKAALFDILCSLPDVHEFVREDLAADHILRRKYGQKNIMLRIDDQIEFYGDDHAECLNLYAESLKARTGEGESKEDQKIDAYRDEHLVS